MKPLSLLLSACRCSCQPVTFSFPFGGIFSSWRLCKNQAHSFYNYNICRKLIRPGTTPKSLRPLPKGACCFGLFAFACLALACLPFSLCWLDVWEGGWRHQTNQEIVLLRSFCPCVHACAWSGCEMGVCRECPPPLSRFPFKLWPLPLEVFNFFMASPFPPLSNCIRLRWYIILY